MLEAFRFRTGSPFGISVWYLFGDVVFRRVYIRVFDFRPHHVHILFAASDLALICDECWRHLRHLVTSKQRLGKCLGMCGPRHVGSNFRNTFLVHFYPDGWMGGWMDGLMDGNVFSR